MPGDGITDVAPLTQQQWNGWYLTGKKPRPYGSQTVDGWIELIQAWDAAVPQDLQPSMRRRRVQSPLDTQEGWFFAPTDTDAQAQVGATQQHLGVLAVKRRDTSRYLFARDIPVDMSIDATMVTNVAAWIAASDAHSGADTLRVARTLRRHVFEQYNLFYTNTSAVTPLFAVVTNIIGVVNYSGGSLALP